MKRSILGLALLVAASAPALAGPIADEVGKAESLLSSGDAAGSLAAFEAAAEAYWTAMPLIVRKAVLIDSADGYGIYTARESDSFPPGAALLIYVEPVGYGYGKDQLGNVSMGFDVDLRLLDAAGAEVGVIRDIAAVELASRTRNREMFFKLTLNLDAGSLKPGRYHADFTLRDKHSAKTATFPLEFEIKA